MTSVAGTHLQNKFSRWKWLAILFGGIYLSAISYSLYTHHRMAHRFNRFVRINESMSHYQKEVKNLQDKAAMANAPGNNIFITKNIHLERKNFQSAIHQFNTRLKKIHFELKSNPEFSHKLFLFEQIRTIQTAMQRMEIESDKLFSNFTERNLQASGQQMARMDQSYALVREEISSLSQKLQNIQNEHFINERNQNERAKKAEIILLLILFLFVAGIFYYGVEFVRFFTGTLENSKELKSQIEALNASAIVAMTDPRGKITYVNQKFIEISGFEEAELIGNDHRILNSGTHSKEFFKQLWNTISSGKPWKGEIKNRRKDGTYYWVDSTIVPIFGKNSEITHFVAIRFDITRRKEFEDLIIAQQEELDQFFEMSQDFLCVAGMDGYFKKVNRTFVRELGFSESDLLSKPFTSLIHPDDIQNTENELNSLAHGVPTLSFSNRFRTRRGTYLNLSWAATPSPEGRLYAIARDITPQIELEKALVAAKETAENASRIKAQFLANMSHEIRTPMNGILGISELLMGSTEDKKVIEKINVIKNSALSLMSLINDILDFSKIEAEKIELEEEPFDLPLAIKETISLFESTASRKNLKLEYKADPSTPPFIRGDSTRLKQILNNLVGNAIKFSENGTILIESKGYPDPEGKQKIVFSVKDCGIGIPEEVRGKLFQSFSQVDASTTRKFGGTGLGLAISKGLAERMGGKIWVESKMGVGSTFFFSIVASLGEKVENKPRTIIKSEIFGMGKDHPLNVLVAEDNKINQVVITGFLEKLGYKPHMASNGQEALEAVAEHDFDLIFMDCHMPLVDGFEAAERIQEAMDPGKKPRIVALTASTMKEDIDRARACGMEDFISKPVEMASLAKALRETPKITKHAPPDLTSHTRVPKEEAKSQVPLEIAPPSSGGPMDLTAFENNFHGMEEVALETIQNFLDQYDSLLNQIESSIANREANQLEMSAHTLKGVVSAFYAKPAKDLAFKLEIMGREGKVTEETSKVFPHLKSQMSELEVTLKEYLDRKKAA